MPQSYVTGGAAPDGTGPLPRPGPPPPPPAPPARHSSPQTGSWPPAGHNPHTPGDPKVTIPGWGPFSVTPLQHRAGDGDRSVPPLHRPGTQLSHPLSWEDLPMPLRDSTVPSPVGAGDLSVPPSLLGYGQGPLTPPCCAPLLPLLSKKRLILHHLCARDPLVPPPGWGQCYCAASGSPLCPGARSTEPQTLQHAVGTLTGDQPRSKTTHSRYRDNTSVPTRPTGDSCQGPAVLNPAVKGGSAALRGHNPGKGAHLPPSQSRAPPLPAWHLGRLYPTQQVTEQGGRQCQGAESIHCFSHEPPTHPGRGGTAPNTSIARVNKSVTAPAPHRASAGLWQRAGEGDFHPPWAGERGH